MRYSNMLKVININQKEESFGFCCVPELFYIYFRTHYIINIQLHILIGTGAVFLLAVLYPISVFDRRMTGGCSFLDQKAP